MLSKNFFKKLVPLSFFFKIKRALVQLDKNTPEFSYKAEKLFFLSKSYFKSNQGQGKLEETFDLMTESNSNGKICMFESISCSP